VRIPIIRGVIDRRILVNYRIDPHILSRLLPLPFRPQLAYGYGIAGICLIRLKQIRPQLFPAWVGIGSENAAHRISVQWDTPDGVRTGVFIPRRDTSSRLNHMFGGRLFPGEHHLAEWEVRETNDRFSVSLQSKDGCAIVKVDASLAESFPETSIFPSLSAASEFFAAESLGYSPNKVGNLDGLELRTTNWQVQPLTVTTVQSTYFENEDLFPKGSVSFDNALLMQGIKHEWESRATICCLKNE
jgi:hypothetical protein